MTTSNPEPNPDTIRTALEHSWNWFELHARQRLLAVEFFLVASAFLSAGYVAALRFSDAVALVISLAGVAVSLCFFGLEGRTRELVRAGEDAMGPLQERLSNDLQYGEIKLIDRVRRPSGWASYHSAITGLYVTVITGFGAGTLYSLYRIFCSGGS